MGSISTSSTSGQTAPIQMTGKSNAATPKLNNEVEMGSLPGDSQAQEEDIMQIARIGDVPAMEKLFESGEYDATYHDDEGITPLHVSYKRCDDCWDDGGFQLTLRTVGCD